MAAEFDERGIQFQYPENWQLEEEEIENGWTVTLQSPDTAFWMLCVREDRPLPVDLLEKTLADLRESYPELESEPVNSTLAGHKAQGHNIRFFSFDLTNTCWTRSFESGQGTVLVLYQFNDLEAENYDSVLRAICASLRVEE
jgi:hypothetical protein